MSAVSISSSPPKLSGHRQARPDAASRTAGLDVLIVDDDRVASPALWTTQGGQRQIRVIATAESSDEAVRLAREKKPHVCMVSATLDGWPSLTCRLKQLDEPPRVLIYGAAADTRLPGRAMLAQADGVCHSAAAPETLAGVISRVAGGEMFFPNLPAAQFNELLDCVDDPDRPIMAMLLERTPPDDIASTLGLSARSLRLRRQAILTRLDAAQPTRSLMYAPDGGEMGTDLHFNPSVSG